MGDGLKRAVAATARTRADASLTPEMRRFLEALPADGRPIPAVRLTVVRDEAQTRTDPCIQDAKRILHRGGRQRPSAGHEDARVSGLRPGDHGQEHSGKRCRALAGSRLVQHHGAQTADAENHAHGEGRTDGQDRPTPHGNVLSFAHNSRYYCHIFPNMVAQSTRSR